MNPQYPNGQSYSAAPNGQTYSAAYASNQQPSIAFSRAPSNGLHLATSHILPPLNSVSHVSGYGNNPLQPSLMGSNSATVNQNGSFPVYGPTAATYYNGTTFAQQPITQTPVQTLTQSPISTQSPQHTPLYTSAPNRLPELAPRTVRDQNFPLAMANGINTIAAAQMEPQPTHVVGSQGRRGILPSAAGRPVAVPGANTSGQKAAPKPAKDAEGKFPCLYCNKNYLHAKHLKRHLLRRE
jgi:hypothetical protein